MTKSFLFETHEITPLTLAVLPKRYENGYIGSIILEKEQEQTVRHAPTKLMDLACKFFGSDLRGKQIGTKAIANVTHKVPICIDSYSKMYFFPTKSPLNPNCAWIAHTHIGGITEHSDSQTIIHFKGGQQVTVDVSKGSLINQINRTAQFRYLFESRLKGIHQNQDPEDLTDFFKPIT